MLVLVHVGLVLVLVDGRLELERRLGEVPVLVDGRLVLEQRLGEVPVLAMEAVLVLVQADQLVVEQIGKLVLRDCVRIFTRSLLVLGSQRQYHNSP